MNVCLYIYSAMRLH